METKIITINNFKPEYDSIAEDLRLKPGSKITGELRNLIAQAVSISKPKVMVKIVSIEGEENHSLLLNRTRFHSRILSRNLSSVHRAFPFIATCGTELDQWKKKYTNIMESYIADMITGMALRTAVETLYNYLDQRFGLVKTGVMNPGSLEDWPLQAQTSLFSLFDDPKEQIGVSLTESMMMVPRQSLSGIIFETETGFINCQLCPREGCPNRRATYNKEMEMHYQR